MTEGFQLSAMHFDSWDGYNPFQYASQDTAQALAALLGGEVVETQPAPPQRLIYLGGHRYFNAGLIALTLMNNPYEVAMQMIEQEAFAYVGSEADTEEQGTPDPFNPSPGPGGPNIPSVGGGSPGSPDPGLSGATPPQEAAEPAALFLFGSGLLGLSLLARRRRAA